MRRPDDKYLYEDKDRHGNVRLYFWRGKGHPKIRIRHPRGTVEFHAAIAKAAAGLTPKGSPAPQLAPPKERTLRWECVAFTKSASSLQLDPGTQRVRRLILEGICAEPIAPGAPETFADFPIARIKPEAIRILRDRKAAHPQAANSRVKVLRRVFALAVEQGRMESNPARDIALLKGRTGGHHSWTDDEVRQYEERHPIGSKARLALALLMFTGQRRSDVVRFGRQHVRDGAIKFTQHKNRNSAPVVLELPMLPELQEIIDRSPTGDLTFLVNEFGRAFTDGGFGNKFRLWCNEAGLPHCSAHGLRKAGAARAAERGATPHTLNSIFGWRTLKQAENYTRAVRQKRLAGAGMHLLGTGPNKNKSFPPSTEEDDR